MDTYDIVCIGAGPTGLATAIEAKRAGMRPLVIDKACLCNSIFHYPVNMVFFTTPELLEIGDLPLVCAAEKPARVEALKYYRKAAEHYALELRLYERVLRVDGRDGDFTVVTASEKGTEQKYHCKKITVATGYYDLPNLLGVPGEELPHVSHYYTEPHEYWNQDVVVIGGKNSAAEAALDLYRNGARVTLVTAGKIWEQQSNTGCVRTLRTALRRGKSRRCSTREWKRLPKTKWWWSSTLKQRESRLSRYSCSSDITRTFHLSRALA